MSTKHGSLNPGKVVASCEWRSLIDSVAPRLVFERHYPPMAIYRAFKVHLHLLFSN